MSRTGSRRWRRVVSAIAFALAAPGAIRLSAAVVELTLSHAWSVEGPDHFQPSGLALRGGEVFTVSDKHSNGVYRISREGEVARCLVAVRFTPPASPTASYGLDLEGIAVAKDGSFHLISESESRVLRVVAGVDEATWVTPGLRPEASAAGLLATAGAGFEGIALPDADDWLLAAEREPRGLVEIRSTPESPRLTATQMEASQFPTVASRALDFADLCVWRGRVFALARNQHLVVELVRGPDATWRESSSAWSYAATENAAEFRYARMTFGRGEGLAIEDDAIYVVLDNNGDSRAGRPGDRRAWLFAFDNPIPRAASDRAGSP